jgi:Tfp pilus assembly protein PilO
MAGVLLELDRIATDSGITFDSITPRPVEATQGYQALPVDLTFEGNYYELSDFLFRVRSLVAVHGGQLSARGRLYNVESIAFTGAAAFPRLSAKLTVSAYVFGGAAQPTTAAQPSPAPAETSMPAAGGTS